MAAIHMDLFGRVVEMDIDRGTQGDGALPDRGIAIIIEIAAVGLTVDHHPGHVQITHATFEFIGRFGLAAIFSARKSLTSRALRTAVSVRFSA